MLLGSGIMAARELAPFPFGWGEWLHITTNDTETTYKTTDFGNIICILCVAMVLLYCGMFRRVFRAYCVYYPGHKRRIYHGTIIVGMQSQYDNHSERDSVMMEVEVGEPVSGGATAALSN